MIFTKKKQSAIHEHNKRYYTSGTTISSGGIHTALPFRQTAMGFLRRLCSARASATASFNAISAFTFKGRSRTSSLLVTADEVWTHPAPINGPT